MHLPIMLVTDTGHATFEHCVLPKTLGARKEFENIPRRMMQNSPSHGEPWSNSIEIHLIGALKMQQMYSKTA